MPSSKIREDLRFLGRISDVTGHDAWLIFDPLQHRYFRIDKPTFHLLSMWNSCDDADALLAAAQENSGQALDAEYLDNVTQFLQAENLFVEPLGGHWSLYEKRRMAKKQSWWQWLVKNYLFVRIPLVRPSRFLQETLPFVAPLLTRSALVTTAILAMVSLYLISRQWDLFINSFSEFYSFEGVLLYGIVLIATKVVHELGHAYTAVRFGCRVPTMGVAVLVMFPVLYTDVSDAWRLRSRQQRLTIGFAGMIVEIMIATAATLFWIFLPDGAAKSVAFVTATLSWTMSLAVNLNPFMRFDGYYLLSDMLSVENLQSRAFSFGRWKLRELLFGLGEQPPEQMPGRLRKTLVLYAWGTWVYRLFLFIGIALLVYIFFFKVLGVLLFVVEIAWFIAKPVWSEIKIWWVMRNRIFSRYRSYASGLVALGLIGLFFLPLSTNVTFPAIVETARLERIYPPDAARIETILVTENQNVKAGDILFQLQSPDLLQKIEQTRLQQRFIEARLRRIASNRADQDNFRVYKQQLEASKKNLDGLKKERSRLIARAPFAGQVTGIHSELHVGRWVNPEQPLATLRERGRDIARGYANEAAVARLVVGSTGQFVPEDFNRPTMSVRLGRISGTNVTAVELPYLNSQNGFGIPVIQQDDGRYSPAEPQYDLRLIVDDNFQSDQVVRGHVKLQARPESLAVQVWRQVLGVLVRESGI